MHLNLCSFIFLISGYTGNTWGGLEGDWGSLTDDNDLLSRGSLRLIEISLRLALLNLSVITCVIKHRCQKTIYTQDSYEEPCTSKVKLFQGKIPNFCKHGNVCSFNVGRLDPELHVEFLRVGHQMNFLSYQNRAFERSRTASAPPEPSLNQGSSLIY